MKKEIQEIINKQLLRQKPTAEQFTTFTEALRNLKDSIRPGETEEHNKTYILQFLRDAFYGKTNLVNTAGAIDGAIYQTKDASSPIDVIIEAKAPNNQAEFPSPHNLNCKAMQELVLYFMRERFGNKNITLKHLIMTNGFEWYIIDASEFERYFADDKKFAGIYDDWDNNRTLFNSTRDFYTDIAKPQIDLVKNNIVYAYVDIRLLRKESEQLRFYRILQPAHLLKQMKFADSNKLNTAFYNELLHIIGLEENKADGKFVIERKADGRRNTFSLLENTIYQLEDFDVTDEKEQFDIALNLVITWINRVLFLKLLESQLISYHGNKHADEYRFLTPQYIRDFDELNELFFKVLALPAHNRPAQVKDKYQHIPYLNSSLFELTENEDRYIRITGLKSGKMPLYNQTVIKDINGHHMKLEMDTLEYLFRFLEAYDFGSDQSDDITKTENKTLINASVLGLIFEKINGYRDGSFFTPAFITQSMCRDAIESTVIAKFNEHFGWTCTTLTDIHNKDFAKQEAIGILDSITLCDPAVGSGHFLVSALNRLIAIRAELGLLQDEDGKRLKGYSISIDNDELIVLDEDGELFHYNPNNSECQRVQKTLFELKRHIIENNLFGSDINPNSVNICRLRLWIELLKHAYYKDSNELETLPNIDINIKCGNSLFSNYPVKVGLYGGINDKTLKKYIQAYKDAVKEYKATSNKEYKKSVSEQISVIKSKLLNTSSQLDLFEPHDKIDEKEQLRRSQNPVEWMIEFPEVLDEDGCFVGFDIVIGNPPYVIINKKIFKILYSKTFKLQEGKIDLYRLFIELAVCSLVKPNGIVSFITPNTFLTIPGCKKLRRHLVENTTFQYINSYDENIFEASVNSVVFSLKNSKSNDITKISYYGLNTSEQHERNLKDFLNDKNVVINAFENNEMASLFAKMASHSTLLKDDKEIEISLGEQPYHHTIHTKEQIDSKYLHSNHQVNDNYLVELGGRNIERYGLKWSENKWLDFSGDIYMKPAIKFFTKPRIIVQQIVSDVLSCTLTDKKFLVNNSCYIILHPNVEYEKFLLAVLNSKAVGYYTANIGEKSKQKLFPRISTRILKLVPIPNADDAQKRKLEEIVDALLDHDMSVDRKSLESQIDVFVYILYKLTYDEVKMIDPQVNSLISEEDYNLLLAAQ